MRILGILDNQVYLSGVNAYWSSMSKTLVRLGHQVHTVAIDNAARSWNHLFFESLYGCVHRLPIHTSSSWEHSVRLFLDVRPDFVVHHYSDCGLNMSLYARSLIRDAKWKDVYVCHSDDYNHYKRIETRKDILAHVICVSETCRNHLIHELSFDPDNTSLLYYFFMFPQRALDTVVRKTSISEFTEPMSILYAGRLEAYQKRAGDLVPFSESLRDIGIPFRLHIAGAGSLEPELRVQLAPLIADGTVMFHGYLDEEHLFALMEETLIYVSFSEFEGLSTSLIQSIHFGLVPLITPTKSGSDFLTHRREAMLFDVGDTKSAALLVQNLFEDFAGWRDMAMNAVEKVTRRFGDDKFSCQLSFLLQRLEKTQHDDES